MGWVPRSSYESLSMSGRDVVLSKDVSGAQDDRKRGVCGRRDVVSPPPHPGRSMLRPYSLGGCWNRLAA